MNKKFLIPVLLSGVLFTSLSFNKSVGVLSGEGIINLDVDAIQTMTHGNGITVDFLKDDIKEYWNSDASDINNLKTLYEYNSDIESFADNSYDREYTRELYAKCDDFKPVNNTLTWISNVKANSYDVVVSLDAELTKAVYEAKGLSECEYTMVNPLANTHYFWQVTAHTDTSVIKSTIFDFYSGNHKRTIDIPTVSNTRDIGGFTGDYGTMKQGLIYRSGRLDDIDLSGKQALAKLNIQTDLDVRSSGEGAENPAKLANYYKKTLISYGSDFTEANRAKTVEAVRVFANQENYPVIFHCAVGRDRTGTLGMILQALCGASKEYIIHDYYTSMWSVTGAYQKSLEGLNLSLVNDTLKAIKGDSATLAEGAEKFLKVREDTLTGQPVGLTDAEIQSIRDIWSGKVEVSHAPTTFMAEENYNGKAFVSIETLGKKDIAMMVNKGTVIEAPYKLNSSLSYYSNGVLFDFTKPINETTYIYSDYGFEYVVTIHFVGLAKEDEILKRNADEVVRFENYQVDGYDMLVISDGGKEISKLVVSRDAYVNIIYIAK